MNKILMVLTLILFVGCSNSESRGGKLMDKEQYYILRGMNNAQEGKYLDAIKELKVAYNKNPKNIVTLRELAYCYGELGDLEEAKKIYGEALKLDPKDLVSIKNIAYINYLHKNYQATRDYLKEIPEKLRDEYSYKLYGYLYLNEKDYDRAYENLRMAVSLNRSFDPELIEKYVEVLRIKKRTSETYRYLDENYELYKNRKDYIIIYSEKLSENFSELRKAERALKRYLAENNQDDEVILELAKNNIEQGKYSEVLKILSLVSSKNSYDSKYLNYKKIAEERLKKNQIKKK
ncbi:MAG: tetratricopeptide repeat protein [Fusobacteriaceae bacterium]